MPSHPYHNVAIVGAHYTKQARELPGHDSRSIALDGALGAVEDSGLPLSAVDGVVGALSGEFIYHTRRGPMWRSTTVLGIPGILDAANAIATGMANVVVVFAGAAGIYRERAATAPWTRPANEFVAPFGMFTTAEFALSARQHMDMYGTTSEALATVAATIRNNGHVNPDAVYYGRGPFAPQDVLASRMVADPFHLLDCAMTSEGGAAVVLARADIALDARKDPVWIYGGGVDAFGPHYQYPPVFTFGGADDPRHVNGWVGRRVAERAFATMGLAPQDVDVCEFYDPFSFEVLRQFEAYGFCGEGEGGDFVLAGNMAMDGKYPTTTDGGLLSFSHCGPTVQLLHRVIRSVHQLRGECAVNQVPGAEVAMCSGAGSGALWCDVMLLGGSRP